VNNVRYTLKRGNKTMQRNFSNPDLRGESFKSQDLTGADFSHADIRGLILRSISLTRYSFSKKY